MSAFELVLIVFICTTGCVAWIIAAADTCRTDREQKAS